MKRIWIFIIAILIISLQIQNVLASWYAGSKRIFHANGISASISTPQDPPNLVKVNSSGLSNWVSTYYAPDGDWVQTGWRYYHWYTATEQYVEWCIDCEGTQGTYEIYPVANQDWGSTVEYRVSRRDWDRWCADVDGIQQFCVDGVHNSSVEVLAKSEIHDSLQNPLDTLFTNVRYKDQLSGLWYLFDDHRVWIRDFPYDVEIFSDSHFHTYRLETEEVFLPIVIK